MKRTIKMKQNHIYYGNRNLGYVVMGIRERFGLWNAGKYVLTIIKGTQFEFCNRKDGYYTLFEGYRRIGIVCVGHFSRLFFRPNGKKKYDIIVERKKTKRKKK